MYEDKSNQYFSYCRTDLLKHIPMNKKNKVLEIGAGSGETLLKAKESGLAEYIVGVDLTQVDNSNQSHPGIDKFIIGNIETTKLDLESNYFDVLMCGDVLEHLVDPWQCLATLRPLLKDGGVIIASIPNIRYWKASMGLVFGGRWNYCEQGVLDRSHLRFFVKETIKDLFKSSGFKIQTFEQMGPQRESGFVAWAMNILTLGALSDLLTVQYIIVASK